MFKLLTVMILGFSFSAYAEEPIEEEPGEPNPIPGLDVCQAYEFLANGYWKEVMGDSFVLYDGDNPSAPTPVQTLQNNCMQDLNANLNDPSEARCFWVGLGPFPAVSYGTPGFSVDPVHTGWTMKCTATRICCINEIDEVPDDDPTPVVEP